jgi:polyamine oxidase
VLVLGGGVAGVLAARKLIRDEGIVEVLVVEARDELGGRMRSTTFGQHGAGGGGGGPFTVELGANWIQGTREGDGPVNPILVLAEKYGVRTVESDYYSSISASRRPSVLLFFWRWGGI